MAAPIQVTLSVEALANEGRAGDIAGEAIVEAGDAIVVEEAIVGPGDAIIVEAAGVAGEATADSGDTVAVEAAQGGVVAGEVLA